MEDVRRIKVVVGVVNGGIGIDSRPWWGLEKEEFKEFLHAMLAAAGFPHPSLVDVERNREDGEVDWKRIRIPRDQCEIADVAPIEAVVRIRRWLAGPQQRQHFGLRFELAENQRPADLITS